MERFYDCLIYGGVGNCEGAIIYDMKISTDIAVSTVKSGKYMQISPSGFQLYSIYTMETLIASYE
jgi:hypothetical protein